VTPEGVRGDVSGRAPVDLTPASTPPTPEANGVYRPGSEVTHPKPLREVRTPYTKEAMQDKVQGVVVVESVVGRQLDANDDQHAEAQAVMLGYDLWRARFGADRAVVGATRGGLQRQHLSLPSSRATVVPAAQ
jgi:hypothetical protein